MKVDHPDTLDAGNHFCSTVEGKKYIGLAVTLPHATCVLRRFLKLGIQFSLSFLSFVLALEDPFKNIKSGRAS